MRVNNPHQVFEGDQEVIGYLNQRHIAQWVAYFINHTPPQRFEVRGFHRRKYDIKPDVEKQGTFL